DINTTSAEFALTGTSYQLVSGKQYNVNFNSELKTGLSQHFNQNFTVPDQTEAAAVAFSKVLDASTKVVAQGTAGVTPPVIAPAGSLRAAAVSVSDVIGFPAGTQFYDTYTSYAAMDYITNVFSIPSSFEGIEHHLMQLKDASGTEITYTGISPYYLSATPALMSMMVVFADSTNGINMQLNMDDYPLVSNADEYVLPFEAVGTFTALVGTDNLEIRITTQVDASKKGTGTTPTANGMNMSGEIYMNGQPFQVEGQNVTIFNCMFNENGIESGYVRAGTQDIGMFARDTTGLKLILLDENGLNKAPIYIQ
ncbi:MAG: hypothetical protein ACD_39C00605G0001, partial [uncultured bacterium]